MSGLEMSQNAIGLQWSREEVDGKLKVWACTLRLACFICLCAIELVSTC